MQTKDMTPDWRAPGWGEQATLRREIARSMSFAERLKWLEGASKTARLLQSAPVVSPPLFARRK